MPDLRCGSGRLDGPTAPSSIVTDVRRIFVHVEQLNKEDCPPKTATAAGVGVEVSATGGGGTVNAPGTSYLGTRSPGTTDERIGLVARTAETRFGCRRRRPDRFHQPSVPSGLPGGPSLNLPTATPAAAKTSRRPRSIRAETSCHPGHRRSFRAVLGRRLAEAGVRSERRAASTS